MMDTQSIKVRRRPSIRFIAIVTGGIVVLTILAFGVADRIQVESRLRANEEANSRTEAALATAKQHSDIFDQNYQVSLEILDTLKSMSTNMRDMTAAFGKQAQSKPRSRLTQTIGRRMAKSPCTLWTESVSVDQYGTNMLIHRQLVPSKKDCANQPPKP